MIPYHFDWSVVSANLGLFGPAIVLTFQVSLVAEVLALAIGLIVALGRLQRALIVRLVATAFIELFRSVPLLVLLIWIYYGLPILIGYSFDAFTAGVLGLALLYGANLAEVFRSGLQAVPKGQREAASTLGLNRWQTSYLIVIPQAVRIVIPALANSFVGMLKDSTLVSVLGLTEFMRMSQTVVAASFRPFEVYTFAAIVYLTLTLIFGRIVAVVERRSSIA